MPNSPSLTITTVLAMYAAQRKRQGHVEPAPIQPEAPKVEGEPLVAVTRET